MKEELEKLKSRIEKLEKDVKLLMNNPPEYVPPQRWDFGNLYSHLPMCDWHYGSNGPTCQGGTVQDETCLNCGVYEKGSNPRVEKYRKEK